ncbi:MAG: UxaA family hydrolase [Blautia sp.]|jgi:altronate dehydratase small subunit
MKRMVQIEPADTVVVCLEEILPQDEIVLDGRVIRAVEHIPMYHKMAVRHIAEGEAVLKYGETIGRATQEIPEGSWVHIHNMESMRGRGDKKGGAAV